MYTVCVESHFSAVHRLQLRDGTLEPVHGHDWRVRVAFSRTVLDDESMVVVFQRARQALESIVKPLHYTDLNRNPALAGRNPTAEVVAKYVFDGLAGLGLSSVRRVEVTEAPGCIGGYEERAAAEDAE